jgi:hypothetical protein
VLPRAPQVDSLLTNLNIFNGGAFAIKEFVDLIGIIKTQAMTGGTSIYAEAMAAWNRRVASEERRVLPSVAKQYIEGADICVTDDPLSEDPPVQHAFQVLSEMMAHQHLHLIDIFRMCDKDCTGDISRKEFISVIDRFDLGLSLHDLEGIAAYADQDQNGRIE